MYNAGFELSLSTFGRSHELCFGPGAPISAGRRSRRPVRSVPRKTVAISARVGAEPSGRRRSDSGSLPRVVSASAAGEIAEESSGLDFSRGPQSGIEAGAPESGQRGMPGRISRCGGSEPVGGREDDDRRATGAVASGVSGVARPGSVVPAFAGGRTAVSRNRKCTWDVAGSGFDFDRPVACASESC